MLDFGHTPLPYAGAAGREVFYGNMSAASALPFTWTKPRGAVMLHAKLIGQGGKGVTATAGATSAGGAGGGSGSHSDILIPLAHVPDVLFLGAGAGGIGTAINTYLAVRPHGATYNSPPVASDVICIAGGAIGLATTIGTSGTLGQALLAGRGITAFYAGVAGVAGGAATGAAGSNSIAITTGSFLNGGAGGGGMSATVAAAGGQAIPSFPSYMATLPGGTAGSSGVAGGAGQPGLTLMDRLIFGAGSGGGAGFPTATASASGAGGAGSYGCGGGGGGGAVTGQTPGAGGNGGQGLIILTWW